MMQSWSDVALLSGSATAFSMWLPLTLLVLAGTVSANYEHGWKVGKEYTYLVRSRTLTSLDQLSDRHTGVLIKALLTIQTKDPSTLAAKVSNGQYARIHKSLPEGWDSEISDQMLELQDLPISGKPFEIKMKHGLIRDIVVDRSIPTWEVNILKSIISQLQVDSQGENTIKSKDMQIPNDDQPYGSFRAMEDSVGGKCEVLYDVMPLPDHLIHLQPELVPKPELRDDGHHIDIMKTKNFKNCDQRINYHFGISGLVRWEPGSNDNGNFLSKSSTSRIIVSGNLKRFTIQSSVTTSKVLVSPRFFDNQNGMVVSRMNLTLANVKKISNDLPTVNNPESTGNLVYVYNDPFSNADNRRVSKKTGGLNSNQILASDSVSSVSSSEEAIKKGEKLRSFAASSSSSSSSSISSSEENDFWQPIPTLEDAPQNPLLPNFVGYKGKFIGKSGKVDVIGAAKELVSQIANELEDPSNIPTQETLEKFTILCSLIRTMNRDQISQVETTVHLSPNELKSNDKTQAVKQNSWAVFRDAVTQAGTGPAFLTIKNWIEKKDITSMEAGDVLSRIPKSARAPTAQYIKAFFELITSPAVKDVPFLNTAALMAFTELVDLSQVNIKSIHNRYPVHTFGRLTPKHDQTVKEVYIPYLGRELEKSIEIGDSRKIQTYVMALGNIGHPKILSVFEPYLEGKIPVTVFQRTLMVSALGKLTDTNPKLARSVLYKIYLNTAENHEVRCTAVFLLMKTNPPLSMLQRMAEFTNVDTNKHVNSAVKSTLESLAELNNPESQELAKKARAAKGLLTSNDYSYQFSHGFLSDTIKGQNNMIFQTILNYIGSDDSMIPRAFYLGWYSSYGDFKTPPTELMVMISSIRSLMEIDFMNMEDKNSIKLAAEKIAEELNIIPDEPIPFEGNLMWNTKFLSRFLPFDRSVVTKIPAMITKHMLGTRDGKYANLNKLVSYDVTLGFPTETGLPFVYTFKVPILYKISGTSQLQMSRDMEISAKSDIRLVYSMKIQGRVGFVAPFDHEHFVAGIDVNFQSYAPIKLSLNANVPKHSVQLKLWPLKGEEDSRLIHYSVLPYTSNHDILNVRPLLPEKTTHLVKPDDVQALTFPIKSEKSLIINIETDESDRELLNFDPDNLEEIFVSPWTWDNDKYRKFDMLLSLEQEQKEPVVLTVAYDSLNAKPDTKVSKEWTQTAEAVEPLNKEPNSEARRKQLLNEAAKGIKLAKSEVLDLQLQIPGEMKGSSGITVAWSSSNVENKGRSLFYWNVDVPSSSHHFEVCFGAQSVSSPDALLFYDQVMQSKPQTHFDAEIRYGSTCSSGEKINVKGKAVQSEKLKEQLKDTSLAMKCQEQMKHGNKILRVCQNAAALALMLDEIHISVEDRSNVIQDMTNWVLDSIRNSEYLDVKTDTSKPKNVGKSKIDIKTKLSEDLEKVNMDIYTPTMDVNVNDIDVTSFGLNPIDFMTVANQNLDVEDLVYNEDEPSCTLDKTKTETFDGREYFTRLGNCWHVVMTAFPKINPENRDEKLHIPEESSVSILSRETQDGQKEVKILLGNDKIKLLPTSSLPKVMLNEQIIEVSQDVSYQKREEDDVIFEIFKLGDRSVRLVSEKFDVDLSFDGKRIMIQASEKYRNSIRGLCGNFDGDLTNDFTGPNSCILRKPELFIASYALTKDQCEGESLENAKSIKSNDCTRHVKNRQSNVISDFESGRMDTEQGNWGYHKGPLNGEKRCSNYRTQVHETDDKICFTTRPVISCTPGCSATETKSKNYQFHCMERNEAALNLKNRIEKGANPDLSQKSVSLSRSINVPLACKA